MPKQPPTPAEYAPTHRELVDRAVSWLKGPGKCSIVFAEMVSPMGIIPDAIGWRGIILGVGSILIECKISRADFRKDADKLIHLSPDHFPGCERLYLTPPGLLSVSDLPKGWGLLEATPKKIVTIHRPQNILSDSERTTRQASEVGFLLSAIRKLTHPRYSYIAGRFTWIEPEDQKLGYSPPEPPAAPPRWTGPAPDDWEVKHDHLKAPVPGERWPYGPPDAHASGCNLHENGLYCDCEISTNDPIG